MTDAPEKPEEVPNPKLVGGDTAVSLTLRLDSPDGREKTHDELWRLIRFDDDKFDTQDVSRNDCRGGSTRATLRQKSFAQGTLFKREIVNWLGDGTVEVTIGYETAGEGDDLEEMARVRGWDIVNVYQFFTHKKIDPRSLWGLTAQFHGRSGGQVFVTLLRAQILRVPILVVTDVHLYPAAFYRRIEDRFGDKVFVAELDTAAAAELTDSVGQGWSCFSGSARVYHPGWSEKDDPDQHAIWRRRKILPERADAEFASRSFCDKVFHELFMQPREWGRKRILVLEGKIEALEKRANKAEKTRDVRADVLKRTKAELKTVRRENKILTKKEHQRSAALIEVKAECDRRAAALKRTEIELKEERRRGATLIEKEHRKNATLKEKVDRLRSEREKLKQEIKGIRRDLRRGKSGTVQGMVEWATSMFGGGDQGLVFGEKVQAGAKKLSPDAGPPEKVLYYLIQLREFAREMRRGKGEVGKPVVDWFRDRDCEVSFESGSTQDMFPRVFPVNGVTRQFDWHMKPSNQAGDQGVRIYFEWDPNSGKVLVGWIGPHLRTRSYGT